MGKSSKVFIALLIFSVAILTFIGSTTYRQIIQLGESSEMVARTLDLENEINTLFSQYTAMQSMAYETNLRKTPLAEGYLDNQKDSIANTFERLTELTSASPINQQNLQKVKVIQTELYDLLPKITYSPDNLSIKSSLVNDFSKRMNELRKVKMMMLNEEELLLKKHKETYESNAFLTPLMSLLLGIFALCIFLIAFWRLNNERKETQRTQNFLESILETSKNVISYFEPVRDQSGKIIDFNMAYHHKNIKDVLEKSTRPRDTELLSKAFPQHFENGVFEHFVTCIEKDENQNFEKQYDFGDKRFWYDTTTTKLNKGILITSRDTTAEKIALDNLSISKKLLEKRNLELMENRAFLGNILKSISNVVMHLKSVRDYKGAIIDFELLFVNDAINNVTGDIPVEIKHKKASEIFPTIFKNKVFENLVTCIEKGEQVDYETHYEKDGTTKWFQATARKLNDGVTVTTRDITEEKSKSERLQFLNDQLSVQNSIFKDAEGVADIGSYVWYLDTGEALISDNFYRILGHEPDSFKVTFKGYRDFVHPDDLEAYDRLGSETTEKGSSNVHSYRIIAKDGKVKHLSLNGRSTQRMGRPVSLGVVQDVTQNILAEQELRNKNEALERSNAELQSFNRVASHDLQEPMRKIQLFVSRISEAEQDRLSEKGKIYFEKVSKAANRMQTLIKYLLAYSRLNKTKDEFKKVSLNDIANEVLADLEERINETGVQINVNQLPRINAIPFQMDQLLNNLISNAIKYRSTSEPAKILIDCKKIPRNKIREDFDKKSKNYYKLSVTDNGIGFDNAHAEKIFGLFERLHQRDEYSGTGIGLAICKKIAENHDGYIGATSELGKGTTFRVYLPA